MNGKTVQQSKKVKGKLRTIPKTDDTLTKKGYSADAKATGDALNARVKKVDVVDNLLSDAADKPLSAKQGAELKKQIDALANKLTS